MRKKRKICWWTAIALFLGYTIPLLAQTFRPARSEEALLHQLAARYPEIMRIDTIGVTHSGIPILAVKLSAMPADTLPAVLFVGGIAPTDITSPAVCVGLLQRFLARWDSVQALLQGRAVYFIPRLSPEPLEGFFERPQRAYVGNVHPEDEDRDGQVDEDDVEDLDGDGVIRWMRIYDVPEAEWTYHPDDSALAQKVDRARGEVGAFQFLPEGRDNDGDLQINEDQRGGVNIDRNFTHRYQPYRAHHGRHPFSEPETRAIGFFLFQHPEILVVFGWTPYDNIHFPWRLRYPENPTKPNRFRKDSLAYRRLVQRLDSLCPFVGEETVPPGSFGEWVFYDAGRLSLCAPAWAYPAVDTMTLPGEIEPVEIRALRWAQQQQDTVLFRPWRSITHPDFPDQRVEVGGFAPFALWNPPPDTLPLLPQRWMPVALELLRQLPRLRLSAQVKQEQAGVYRVDLVVRNIGELPTHTVVGRAVRALRPLHVRVHLAKGQHLLNRPKHFVLPQPLQPGEQQRLSLWIVGRGTTKITVGSSSAGRQTVSVRLQ